MPTTIVWPSLDVSGTGSISTIVSTAGTFAGSLTASTFAVTGTATFSGTAVFLTTAQFAGTTTFSGTAVFLTSAVISGTLSTGGIVVTAGATFNGSATFSGTAMFLTGINVAGTLSGSAINLTGPMSVSGAAVFKGTITVSATASVGALTVAGVPVGTPNYVKIDSTAGGSFNSFYKASGAWSVYYSVDVQILAKGAATTTNLIIGLYADGGTTPFVTFPLNPIASATASEVAAFITITGTKDADIKIIYPKWQIFNGVTNQAGQFPTATFTTSGINAIGIITGAGATTTTMSSASIVLWGRT